MDEAGGQEQEGIYYQGITGMKADMSGVRTIPKLMELQHECLAQHEADDVSSSDESENEDIDASVIPGLLDAVNFAVNLDNEASERDAGAVPEVHNVAAQNQLQLRDDQSQSSDDVSSEEDSDDEDRDRAEHGSSTPADLKAEKKAHKKAVKEANRERRKHKMPKHVKKKKMNSHKKK